MTRQFLRVDTVKYSRLGKGRRKLRKWRRPRGKQNKVRLCRAGYPVMPSIGFKTPRNLSGKIEGLTPKLVHNINELASLAKNEIAIIARVGAKKKMEMLKKADELKIKILNIGKNKK